jgi:hypothetical protein
MSIQQSVGFEWDENKRQRNVEKHGIDFLIAAEVFDGLAVVTYYSPRSREDRWATVGELNGRLCVVVWTERATNRRIIAAYRADEGDERKYRQVHG